MTSARLLKIAAALKGAGRPSIKVEPGKLVELAIQGEDALLAAGMPIFKRDTFLVRPAMDEVDAAHGRRTRIARLVPLSKSYLRGELCRAANWERFNLRKNDWTPTNPPGDVAELILARHGDWRLLQVGGVLTTPTLRADGTVLHRGL
jgi:putative DNA primase/helicase